MMHETSICETTSHAAASTHPNPNWEPLLLVEDDDDIRQELRELLEEEGFFVVEAHNGQEALDALERGLRPTLVVLDMMMPVMDGWEFLERIRSDAWSADLPVLLATAVYDKGSLPRGVSVLQKPYNIDTLMNLVHTQRSA
jgi:CheY-like chemotaxis protein